MFTLRAVRLRVLCFSPSVSLLLSFVFIKENHKVFREPELESRVAVTGLESLSGYVKV